MTFSEIFRCLRRSTVHIICTDINVGLAHMVMIGFMHTYINICRLYTLLNNKIEHVNYNQLSYSYCLTIISTKEFCLDKKGIHESINL